MTNEQRIQSMMDKMLHKLTNIDMNIAKLLKQIERMQNASKNVDVTDDGK